jgi:hypothetical protein
MFGAFKLFEHICKIANIKALSLCSILGEIAKRRNMALRLNKEMAKIMINLITPELNMRYDEIAFIGRNSRDLLKAKVLKTYDTILPRWLYLFA